MGSIGGAIGAFVGGVAGFIFGGPVGALIGFQLGLGIGSFIDPPTTSQQNPQLPTFQDIQYNTFARNLPVPIVYGTNQVAGNVVWIGNTRTEVIDHSTDLGGGKGGGGGGTITTQEIVYYADFHVALAEGSINGVSKVTLNNVDISSFQGLNYDVNLGSPTQAIDTHMTTAHSVNALPFRNTAYLAFHGRLGNLNRIPNINVVVEGRDNIATNVKSGADWTIINTGTGQNSGGGAGASPYGRTLEDTTGRLFAWWAPTYGDNTPQILRSTDGGSVWVSLPTTPTFTASNQLIFDMSLRRVTNTIYASGPWNPKSISQFWKSSDGGDTWEVNTVNFAPFSTFFGGTTQFEGLSTPNAQDIYTTARQLTGDGSITFLMASHDDGVTWAVNSLPRPTRGVLSRSVLVCPEGMPGRVVVAVPNSTGPNGGYYGSTVYVSDNDGATWTMTFSKDLVYYIGSTPIGTNRGIAFTGGGPLSQSYRCPILTSFNGGDSWQTGDILPASAGNPPPAVQTLTWFNESHLFVEDLDTTKRVFESRDGGASWVQRGTDVNVAAGYDSYIGQLIASTHSQRLLHPMSGQYPYAVSELLLGPGGCNPAWIVRDLLINKRYGLGLDVSRLDAASFNDTADYADTLVVNPDGTSEQRFCLDIVLETQRPVLDHLRDMLSTFRGFLVWSQGTVKLRVAKDEAVTQAFDMGSIIADSFEWRKQSYRDRPNIVRIEYINSLDEFRTDFVEAFDDWDINQSHERRERLLRLTGIKRPTQASRMAQYYLDQAIHINQACTFRVGIAALAAEVGDVISVSHDIPAWTAKSFRILEISEAENDEMVLTCIEYNASIYHDHPVSGTQGNLAIKQDPYALPYQVIRLSPYKRPLESSIEIAYTRSVSNDLFGGAILYRQRGSLGYESIPNPVISLAPTAYLDSQTQSLGFVSTASAANLFTVKGVPAGWGVRLSDGSDVALVSALGSGGSAVLSLASTPISGNLRVYQDSTYTLVAPNGRFPASGSSSFSAGDIYQYLRGSGPLTATQTSVPIYYAKGGFTNVGSARIRGEEFGYSTFADSLLSGATRGAGGSTATSHTNVLAITLLVGSGSSATGSGQFINISAAATDIASNVQLWPQNSRYVVVLASSRFTRITWDLETNATAAIPVFYEYSTGDGIWASLTLSGFLGATDTTNGFTKSGATLIEPPGNWATTANLTSGAALGATGYAIRMLRSVTSVAAVPKELRVLVDGETLITGKPTGAYVYTPLLADSGQTLTFKAIAVSPVGQLADGPTAPTQTLLTGLYLP